MTARKRRDTPSLPHGTRKLPVTMSTKRKTSCLLAGLCLSPLAAMAQTPPNAGQILRQATPAPQLPATQAPRTVIEEAMPAQPGNGESVPVTGIHFSGNTVFDESTLQRLVADSLQPRMQLAGGSTGAAGDPALPGTWLSGGPRLAAPQDISNGTVTIAVLEASSARCR